jgi:Tfp pilus assembly protein PilF
MSTAPASVYYPAPMKHNGIIAIVFVVGCATGPSNKAQPTDPNTPSATSPEPRPDPAPEPRPDPADAYRTGLQQYARGDSTGALATLRASASANPGYAPTWLGLGLIYEKLGNKAEAKLAFKRYLQLAPDAGDADQIRDRIERLGS